MNTTTLIISSFLLFISCEVSTQSDYVNEKIIKELEDMANSKGYEFVYGDRFPLNNPYGSYGASCVFDILQSNTTNSVLFLCRKPNEYYSGNTAKNTRDLVFEFDYALIYATKEMNDSHFNIKNVLTKEIGLKGFYFYYGMLDIELSDFNLINDENQFGPEGKFADLRSGALPVFITSNSSQVILYYYDKKWYEYVERDE